MVVPGEPPEIEIIDGKQVYVGKFVPIDEIEPRHGSICGEPPEIEIVDGKQVYVGKFRPIPYDAPGPGRGEPPEIDDKIGPTLDDVLD